MQRLNDPDVIKAITNAPGLGHVGELPIDFPATLNVAFPANVTFKYVRDTTAAYLVVTSALFPEPIVFRLAVSKQPASKEETRSEARKALDEYIANGRQITTIEPRKGSGLSTQDWKRLQQGLKVATAEEIKAERERRMLICIRNGDHDNAIKLATKGFDREIKFDIENGRLGPNGEIR